MLENDELTKSLRALHAYYERLAKAEQKQKRDNLLQFVKRNGVKWVNSDTIQLADGAKFNPYTWEVKDVPKKENNYYDVGGLEVIDILHKKLTPEEFKGFCKGNIIKYILRANYKGDEVKDYKKAAAYAGYLNRKEWND